MSILPHASILKITWNKASQAYWKPSSDGMTTFILHQNSITKMAEEN
jgi:hypothetical protein